MTMRDRLMTDSTRGAPAEAVLHAGPGGDEAMVLAGASAPQPVASAWDVLAGQPGCESDLLDYVQQLEGTPELRSAATLRSLDRLRDALERVPESAGLGDPITIRLQDAALFMRQMLSRLR